MADNNNKDLQNSFYIFFGGMEVSIEWDTIPLRLSTIQRICSITAQYFLILLDNNNLHEARFDEGQLRLRLSFLLDDVHDVQYCRDIRSIYIVMENGSVLSQTFKVDRDLSVVPNDWKAVSFDPLELAEEGVRIKRVCCSSDGTIFISAAGDIYALGNCGIHFSVDCDQPKLIRLFKSPMEILDLNAGDKFFVFLAKKESTVTSVREYGELPDLVCSDIHHKQEHELSPSSVHSSLSNNNLESNIQVLLRQGHSLLHTEVYTMGSVNRGLLGTGDHIKRDSILTIEKLKDIGVCSLATGSDHTVVRTIDGCLYHWGLNNQQQLTTRSQVYELSSPTELTFDSSDLNVTRSNILEACCGDYRTVLLNTQGDVYEGEKILMNQEKDFVTLQMKDNSKQSYPLLLASSNLTIYNRRQFKRQFYTFHRHIQTQTKTMLGYHKRFQQIKKLAEKMILKDIQQICYQWENVLHLVIVILSSLEQLYRGDYDDSSELLIVKYFRESIQIFETYSKAYCDIYSIDGFYEAQQMLFHHSRNPKTTPAPSSINDSNNEVVLKMFKCPFQMYPHITQLLEYIQKTYGNCQNELVTWLEFIRRNRIDMELAENTRDFWQSNQKNTKIANFKRKERRVILCSTSVPIKLSHSIGLTTPVFILFSDCLCQVANNVVVYPLDAIWLKKDDCGITIKTPEKKIILISRSQMDKDLWYDQLESSIKSILNLSEKSKIPEVRSIEYNFSNHSIYSGVYVKGNFSNAVMHGKCRLEFPSGKMYAGDIIHGVIEGYGHMFLPKVGLFKGYFKNGKFSGHGTLIISETEIYEGNFRNGLFHGHGHLQHADYIYVGEFEDNLKCGYGVMDKLISGEKYIGMFADNKRIGSGICITASGNYFEGYFANDELTGKSVAIFPNHYYYEGESSLTGPNGAGKYYMSGGESKNDELEPILTTNLERTITGNILNGQLSGTWENVRIHGNSSSIEINVNFPEYPSTLGSHIVDNSRKWSSLFNDFESEIFEDLANATHDSSKSKAITFALWNRVIAFINKQQEIQNAKAIPRELDITNDTSPSTVKNSSSQCLRPLQTTTDDFDKLSLNSSLFSVEKLELNKSHSQSEDTLLNGLDFSNFDLLSTFSSKFKYLNSEENQVNSTLATLMGVIDSCNTTATIDSFNDSALSSSSVLEECISLQTEMELIPPFGLYELHEQDLSDIKAYLKDAFRYRYHPLKHLNDRIAYAFYRSYGCWKIKPTPLLAKQAMWEWESISQRVYKFIRRLFPALPEEYTIVLGEQREVVSHVTLLYPIVLSESIYSTLFVLYASKYSHKDEIYRQNLLLAEKLSDEGLVHRLKFDADLLAVVSTDKFSEAIQMLKELKEKYSPMAMLTVIENCMEKLTHAYQQISENQTSLNADVIMPLTLVLLLRAGIHHLGAELALLDDLTDSKNFQFEMNGIRGYCYTTIKASYEHLANKSLFENN